MKNTLRLPPTVLFTIRLWQEWIDDEQFEWRGEIKNVASGEVRYFREWATLADLLPRMLLDGDDHGWISHR